MLMTLLLFASGFALSSISTIYAIIGLLSIFPAAPTTIMIMGTALEVSKLVIASFLYRNWKEIPKFLKTYFCIAMVVLMILTSMSIFGMLSKAHIDSGIISGDSIAALQIVDEKIAAQKENILQSKKALTQMDAQVNEMLSRTTDEKGTDKAIKARGLQKKERLSLALEINQAQSEISKLQAERAPLAVSVRKVEAEVGPIKYIANLIYGDNIDSNMLERAVRWVILMIVFVFDPLAVLLLIAANWNLKHHERIKTTTTNRHIETVEDVTTTNTEEFDIPNDFIYPEIYKNDVLTKVHIEEPKVAEVETEVHIEPEIENKDANESLSLVESAAAMMSKTPVPGVKNIDDLCAELQEEQLTGTHLEESNQKVLDDSFELAWHDQLKQQEKNYEATPDTDILHPLEEGTTLSDKISDSSDAAAEQTIAIASVAHVADEQPHVQIH